MFIHDHYKKIAIEAIKKDLSSFDEDSLREVAYNEVDFNNRVFIFDYSNDVNYLYIITVHPNKTADVEVYFNEYGYSIVDGKVE